MSELMPTRTWTILNALNKGDSWRRWGNLLEVCAEMQDSPIKGTREELTARTKFARTEEAYALRTAKAHQADIPTDFSI